MAQLPVVPRLPINVSGSRTEKLSLRGSITGAPLGSRVGRGAMVAVGGGSLFGVDLNLPQLREISMMVRMDSEFARKLDTLTDKFTKDRKLRVGGAIYRWIKLFRW